MDDAAQKLFAAYSELLQAGMDDKHITSIIGALLAPTMKPITDVHNAFVRAGFAEDKSRELIINLMMDALK